jgi:hypothetical protein
MFVFALGNLTLTQQSSLVVLNPSAASINVFQTVNFAGELAVYVPANISIGQSQSIFIMGYSDHTGQFSSVVFRFSNSSDEVCSQSNNQYNASSLIVMFTVYSPNECIPKSQGIMDGECQ